MHLDDIGLQVIDRLRQKFPIVPKQTYLGTSDLEKSICPIGIEVEIPWRGYFPLLWKKYFGDGKKFEDFTPQQIRELQSESAVLESELAVQLQKTIECGISRGRDRYWEFSFSPVENVEILAELVAILSANDLCPLGPYSLHVTVGKLRPTGRVYLALLLLELVHSSASRIASGINRENRYSGRAWARKGRAGIHHKTAAYLTFGDSTAIELRTLQLPESVAQLLQLLQRITCFAKWLYQEQQGAKIPEWDCLVEFLQELLRAHSLEVKNWENPATQPILWERYVAAFPSMSATVKKTWLK